MDCSITYKFMQQTNKLYVFLTIHFYIIQIKLICCKLNNPNLVNYFIKNIIKIIILPTIIYKIFVTNFFFPKFNPKNKKLQQKKTKILNRKFKKIKYRVL
jgi:hypothetical protein